MKSMDVYVLAAAQLGTTPGQLLFTQANIAWAAFMAEPTKENAGKVQDYLHAWTGVQTEPVKRRTRTLTTPQAEGPDLGKSTGYGEPGTVDAPVAAAQKRRSRRAPAIQEGGDQGNGSMSAGSSGGDDVSNVATLPMGRRRRAPAEPLPDISA